jgi:K(+)-stimulated pyrophosphate-energized sodium pump
MFIGSMMAFLFCGLTMNAVGRAAAHMVEEVRRQFREIKGILTGESEPDYERCVAISTQGAQREMVFPSLLAIVAPIATGLIFGVSGVVGFLSVVLAQDLFWLSLWRMPEGLGIMPRSMSKRVISEESTVKYIKRRLLEIRWAIRSKTRLVRV